MDRGAVRRGPSRAADLRPAPPPAPDPGHGARAEHRLRRGRRDRMPAAVGCRHRPLRPQARPLCLAARGPVRDQCRHRLLSAPPGQDPALLQPDRDHRPPRGRLAEVPVPRAGEDHPVLHRDALVREIHGSDRGRGDPGAVVRTLALIDGEHYPATVRDALADLPYEFVGALMVGGTEKLRGDADYGVPVYDDLGAALGALEPEIVLDLSDEPVLGPAARFRLAS